MINIVNIKPVLAREREARLKDERCRSMFSNTVATIATRRNKGGQRQVSTNTTSASEEGPIKSSGLRPRLAARPRPRLSR